MDKRDESTYFASKQVDGGVASVDQLIKMQHGTEPMLLKTLYKKLLPWLVQSPLDALPTPPVEMCRRSRVRHLPCYQG